MNIIESESKSSESVTVTESFIDESVKSPKNKNTTTLDTNKTRKK